MLKPGEDKFFKILGVPLLKRFIMATVGKFLLAVKKEKSNSYFVRNPFCRKSLRLTLRWSYFNEIVHLFIMILCIQNAVSFWGRNYYAGVFYMVVIALFNLWLVMIQQYNRRRITRLIAALTERKPG